MDREKVISTILNHSELFTESELHRYSDQQLKSTLDTLFLFIRIERLQSQCHDKP